MRPVRLRPSSFTGIKKRLGYLKPIALAKKLKVVVRKPKKILVTNLLLSYWLLISKGKSSYENWAMELSMLQKETVSSQAIWKRVDSNMLIFVEELLEKSLRQKCDSFVNTKLFGTFRNVEIQDATHFRLPKNMHSIFPGSGGKGEGTSTAKIQAVFNLKKGNYSDFKLTSYRENDQGDSPRFVEKLKKNDLIIRDLGYAVLGVFNEIIDKKAYFLSRYKYKTTVFDAKSGKKVSLLKLLKKRKQLDMEVILGAKKEVTCRLVAIPLPEEVANTRRMRAEDERHEDANHSDEYMALLGYSIFITNVPAETWSMIQVAEAYRCRWYIEILFKSWKSHLNFKMTIPDRYVNEHRVKFFFYATLLMVTLLVMPFFAYLQKKVGHKAEKSRFTGGKQISILRLCGFVNMFLLFIIYDQCRDFMIEMAEKFCTYQLSNQRKNSIQMIYTDF